MIETVLPTGPDGAYAADSPFIGAIATPEARPLWIIASDLLDEIAIHPDHLRIKVSGAPRMNVTLQEVGLTGGSRNLRYRRAEIRRESPWVADHAMGQLTVGFRSAVDEDHPFPKGSRRSG